MPLLIASFESRDRADLAIARLRRLGIPFNASYRNAPVRPFPGGVLANIVYPFEMGFSAPDNHQNTGLMVVTDDRRRPLSFSQETVVQFRLNHSKIATASSVLRNSGAFSISTP
jgi:hypothetical protein